MEEKFELRINSKYSNLLFKDDDADKLVLSTLVKLFVIDGTDKRLERCQNLSK